MKHYDVLVLSGGFDPLHVGHIRMVQQARDMAALVVVGVNSDDWLMRNKGRVYMKFEERREIVASIRGVTSAVGFNDADDTAINLLQMVNTMSPGAKIAFGNGGMRTALNVPGQSGSIRIFLMTCQFAGSPRGMRTSMRVSRRAPGLTGMSSTMRQVARPCSLIAHGGTIAVCGRIECRRPRGS